MNTRLTKPQERLLWKALRAETGVCVSRSGWRVAGRLEALGYLNRGSDGGTFYETRAGLEALLYEVKMADCREGSMASMLRVQEVEATLAARFPEPLKAAA